MKVLFDTNVVLDLLLEREPFAKEAAHLISLVETQQIGGLLCATSVTTIHYLLGRHLGTIKTTQTLAKLLSLFEIAPVGRPVLQEALDFKGNDYEDSVVIKAALHAGASAIVTRDARGFDKADTPVYTPTELIALLKGRS